MNPSTAPLDGDDFAAMAVAMADAVNDNAGMLSSLDAVSGDGDHGANVQRAMTRARTLVDELPTRSPGAVLDALATACGETMAGAAGAVFAAFFGGAAVAISDEPTADADALSRIFAAGLQRVQRISGAAVGDKSIVDALAPAVDATKSTAARTADVVAVLSSAATAARAGAKATTGMSDRVGRARYAESGGRGSPDPGAVTVALVLESWVDAVGGRRRIDQGVEQPRSVDASPESTDRSLSGRQ